MYNLYKGRKRFLLLPITLFGGAIPFLLYVLWTDFEMNGLGINIFLGLFFTMIDVLAFLLFVNAFKNNPYKRLQMIGEINPALLSAIEADFNEQNKLCKNVYRGNYFYYFLGGQLLVVPIGGVRQIKVYKRYSRNTGVTYYYEIKSDQGNETLVVAILGRDKEGVLSNARRIASECGIEAEITF